MGGVFVSRLPDVGGQELLRQSDAGRAGSRPSASSRPDHGLAQGDGRSAGAASQDHGDESAVPAVRQVELHVSETQHAAIFYQKT